MECQILHFYRGWTNDIMELLTDNDNLSFEVWTDDYYDIMDKTISSTQ